MKNLLFLFPLLLSSPTLGAPCAGGTVVQVANPWTGKPDYVCSGGSSGGGSGASIYPATSTIISGTSTEKATLGAAVNGSSLTLKSGSNFGFGVTNPPHINLLYNNGSPALTIDPLQITFDAGLGGVIGNISNFNFLDGSSQYTAGISSADAEGNYLHKSSATSSGAAVNPSTGPWTFPFQVRASTIMVNQIQGATYSLSVPIGKDFSGNGYDATINGSVPRGDGFLGVHSASFTGNNSNYLRNTSVPALVNGVRTWSFWMKTSSINVIAVGLGVTASNNRIEAASFQSASTWDLYGRGGGANDVTGATCTVNALNGAWHHVALSYDGVSRTNLWVDGTLNGVARRTSGSYDTSAGILVGIWGDLNRGMVGLVDDVGLWNVQLTTAQVQSLYNSGTGNPASTIPTGLQAYYSFENNLNTSSFTVVANSIDASQSTATFNVVYSTGGLKTKWLETSSVTATGLIQGTSGYFSNVRSTTGINTGWINSTSSMTVTSTATFGNFVYVGSSISVGTPSLMTVADITNASMVYTIDAGGNFFDAGYCYSFDVYAYKTVGANTVYSQTPANMADCDPNTSSDNYYWYMTWDAVSDATGYILYITGDEFNGYFGDAYVNIAASGFAEFAYDTDGGIITSVPTLTPTSAIIYSTVSYVNGNQTVLRNLSVGGDGKFTGSISSTGTITSSGTLTAMTDMNVSGKLHLTSSSGTVKVPLVVENSTITIHTSTNSTRANVGGCIWDHYVSSGNNGTTETDLYRDIISSNTLSVNGRKIEVWAAGTLAGSATATRQLKIYIGTTTIFDSGAITLSVSGDFRLDYKVIRETTTSVLTVVALNTPGASTSIYTTVSDVGGINFNANNTLKITGTAAGVGAASNDLTAKLGSGYWYPAAN